MSRSCDCVTVRDDPNRDGLVELDRNDARQWENEQGNPSFNRGISRGGARGLARREKTRGAWRDWLRDGRLR